ncbi:polysaccharide lyase family 8 super-sandwich domain-containing protein [Romboutsia sp. Marseille-P6047]|uniref:polysaccharide lyase family 8 super-sandwich domain-containing protein n=1 Tax=Romboutsia sp. Marseille-P6047 TaxID=2161817 RepID=UPI000F05D251|nr:polysaccharide lyase family 8 super-sandwich domain-containing protein [Romboutsia sp. Marseille-P6047]
MNKKRSDRGLYKSLATILVANSFTVLSPVISHANQLIANKVVSLENTSVISKDYASILNNNLIDFNGSFEDKIGTGNDISLWKDKVKPKYWEVSSYGNGNAPKGEIVNDVKDGKNAVKLVLNNSIGFFKTVTGSSPKIESGRDYKLSTWIKTENLVSESNMAPILIKVEQLDSKNNVLERNNIDTISDANEWTNLSGTITANEKAERLRIVVQIDEGLKNVVSGNVYLDDFTLEELEKEPTSISLNESSIEITPGNSKKLDYTIEPLQANKQNVVWTSSDQSVAKVDENGLIKANKAGSAKITATIEKYPQFKAECKIEVKGTIEIEKIEFESDKIEIENNKHYVVKAKTYPQYSNEEYSLVVENENIATIENGIVRGIGIGTTTVKAINSSGGELGSFELNVKENEEDKYDVVLNKIYDSHIPNDLISPENNKVDQDVINDIVDAAKAYWNKMYKDTSKKYIWDDLSGNTSNASTNSNHITKSFERLREMSKAYLLEGSELKGNSDLLKDIVYGLDWLIENKYNASGDKVPFGNWWDWQIGAPQKLTDTLIILKDYLTEEQFKNYAEKISYYAPNARDMNSPTPTISSGANRVDMCQVVLYTGLLIKNDNKVKESSNDLLPELKYVTNSKTNGIYKDGSLIQHDAIPYTGTYGAIFLEGVGKLNYLLDKTEWSIPQENVNMLYDVIKDSFEPLMYKGVIMDMVNGRSISRSNWQDIQNGDKVVKSIVKYFIPSATSKESSRLKGVVKYWVESNKDTNIVNNTKDLEYRAMLIDILNDDSVESSGPLQGHYNFAMMDRVVHRNSEYSFGISAYSDRTYMYEAMNQENLKGYHTSDGMTYLYNGDTTQYSRGFWATVNSNRLPGTTVDTLKLYDGANGSKVSSNQSWVGGSVIEGKYGVSGMYLDKNTEKEKNEAYKMDLTAKKSWFMFDDEIVALGSDIDSTKDRTIETIIENRVLSNEGTETFTVDGDISIKELGNLEKKEGASWAHIKGEKENTDIGYYFPNKANINILRENRTGNWKDINGTESDKIVKNNYLTMWINHGVNPNNEKYSYVLLPNKSLDEVKEYNEKPNIEILSNTESVHAVKEKELNITAANFWDDNQSVDFIYSDKQSSVIVREDSGVIKIGVSDPTMKNEGKIRIELHKKVGDLISKDDRIEVIDLSDKLILEVNVNGANGSTINAEFSIKETNSLNAPENVRITKKSSKSVSLAWDNPNDKKDAKYYEVYLDGELVDKVKNEKIKLKISNQKHIFNVRAVDKYGNKSDISEDVEL